MGSKVSEFITFFERLKSLGSVLVIVSKRIPSHVESAGWLIDACSRVKRGGGELVQVEDASGVQKYASDRRAKLCIIEAVEADLRLSAGPCLTAAFPNSNTEVVNEGTWSKDMWVRVVVVSMAVLLLSVLFVSCRTRSVNQHGMPNMPNIRGSFAGGRSFY